MGRVIQVGCGVASGSIGFLSDALAGVILVAASWQVGALGRALVGTGTIRGATWPRLKLFGVARPRTPGRVLPTII